MNRLIVVGPVRGWAPAPRSGYPRRAPVRGRGRRPQGRLHYPGFGAEAASWLIEQRSVGALGIDTMGIDPGADTSFGTNRLLLRDHRIHWRI